MSILKIDSRIQISEDHVFVSENSTPILRPTILVTPLTPNLRGHRPETTENKFCFPGKERQHISSLGAKSDTFWQDTSGIRHPFDTSSIRHPFGTTRSHCLDFTTANLLWPNFTIVTYILPTNKNQHLELPFIALERQQSRPRVHSSMLNSYITSLGRSNNQFDQSIATDVMFYFIKT